MIKTTVTKTTVIKSALWIFACIAAHTSQATAISLKEPASLPQFTRCHSDIHGTAFYGAQCTQITTQSALGSTTLNVLRARALSTPKNNPLVVITGGPGTSAVSLAWQYLGFFSDIQKERDIIFIDQRGTGKTEPFTCAAAGDINPQLPQQQQIDHMHSALEQCAKEYSAQALIHINTAQAASDIEAVRQALGYNSLNLWGSSYGTRVAMAYQHQYPATARAVILDGAAPAAIALPRYAEHDAGAALKQLFEACAKQAHCKRTFGDLTSVWQQLLAGLTVQPIQASLTHPRTTKTASVTVTPALAANWVRFALYSRELAALLPLAIQHANEGRFTYLANLAQAASDSVQNGMHYGMHAAILCAEDQHAPTVARKAVSLLPSMPFARLNDLSPVCQTLKTAAPAPDIFEPINSTTPTLVLSGQFDPITPAFWGEWASQNMANSRHIIVEGGHHGVSGLGCIPELMASFIDQGSHTALDASCVSTIKPTHFFINAAGPALRSSSSSSSSHQEAKP